jgi:hypothetical protein
LCVDGVGDGLLVEVVVWGLVRGLGLGAGAGAGVVFDGEPLFAGGGAGVGA